MADLNQLRTELSIKAKNGIDFITSASIVWLGITYIWTLPYSSHSKSVLTFFVGAVVLPLALLLSKVYKTTWTIKENPLQPLGLWLNFAQLVYFPFLIFTLSKEPDYFVMVYVIITGAHFFPYSWYYNTKLYAVFSILISVGALIIGMSVPLSQMYLVALFISVCLIVLAVLLHFSYKKRLASAGSK
ncbi:hypothetical protein WSM22_21320 [Cytophagales bacterium WSM2-2]|nr:hypothetical protein WSM22_21320 [Cytophagales bacterium WSM2-2]